MFNQGNRMDNAQDKKFDIAVILPTRGRTTALLRSIMSLVTRTRNLDRIQFFIGLDEDDPVGIDYWQKEVEPLLVKRNANFTAMLFEPLGYIRLNEYVTEMAKHSNSRWIMFWNDDAIMESQNWDEEIMKYEGQFKILAVHTHREHPYSIFPIVPHDWIDLFGYMSPHQLSDAWISQVAYMLDIFERIPVWVTHDRYDLTGNNNDATYNNRPQLENQPNNPDDFHSEKWHARRVNDAERLSKLLESRGIDQTWWTRCKSGEQDPWVKLSANDINKQMTQTAKIYDKSK
jgi:hypothetical protein